MLLALSLVPRGSTTSIKDRVEQLCKVRQFEETVYLGNVFETLICLDHLGLVSSKVIDRFDDRHRFWTVTPLGERVLTKKTVWQRAVEKVEGFA